MSWDGIITIVGLLVLAGIIFMGLRGISRVPLSGKDPNNDPGALGGGGNG